MGGFIPTLLYFARKNIKKVVKRVVIAKFKYPSSGYSSDVQRVKECGLIVDNEYPVKDIRMGQSYTSVCLDGIIGSFNSVHFEFFEDGEPLNIYRDSRFNPYIGRGRNGEQN